MNADREPNRLPLRAGAMLLLAVAIVCIGLGWHSAVSGDDDDSGATTNAAMTSTESSASAGSTSGAPSESGSAGDGEEKPTLCVLNAGQVSGLAGRVAAELKKSGYAVPTVENLPTSSITENTIFYGSGEQAAAQKLAEIIPGGANAEARPDAFTRCSGKVAVIVVTE